jgi:hypothetical protein
MTVTSLRISELGFEKGGGVLRFQGIVLGVGIQLGSVVGMQYVLWQTTGLYVMKLRDGG